MDIIPSDLATYGGEAKNLLRGFAEPERAKVFAYAVSFECGRHKAEIGQRRISGRKYRTEIQLYAHPP